MSRHPLVAVYGERGIERFKRAFCGGATGRCNIRCNISVCKRCSLAQVQRRVIITKARRYRLKGVQRCCVLYRFDI
ncbi:TPA: hypothetical protein ENX78_10460 [Candidatus Poribacteria bacterium]|nr:hypothetical protein [Candidatus Poribacteria bacterium]